jgi:hypothetical protein
VAEALVQLNIETQKKHEDGDWGKAAMRIAERTIPPVRDIHDLARGRGEEVKARSLGMQVPTIAAERMMREKIEGKLAAADPAKKLAATEKRLKALENK